MARKVFCCCSLRAGVIFIGAVSIALSLLGMALLCYMSYQLTASVLARAAQRPASPSPSLALTPAPDTEIIRLPRARAPDTIENYRRLRLRSLGNSLPLTDESSRNQGVNNDTLEENHNQNEIMKKNNSINGSEQSNAGSRQQTEEITQKIEPETRSPENDRSTETATETNMNDKQSEREEKSPNSFATPQSIVKSTSTQGSTENPITSHQRDSPNVTSEYSTVASPGRQNEDDRTSSELEVQDGANDENWRETQEPSCGGADLEELMWKISFLTAYETNEQSRATAQKVQGSVAIATALFGLVFAMLLFGGFLEMLHLSVGVLLIVGAAKRNPGLLRPWRLLAVFSWALTAGAEAVSLCAALPLRALNPDLAQRRNFQDIVAVSLLVVYLAVYAYFYSVVLKFEQQLRKESQENNSDNCDTLEKKQGKVYSSRF